MTSHEIERKLRVLTNAADALRVALESIREVEREFDKETDTLSREVFDSLGAISKAEVMASGVRLTDDGTEFPTVPDRSRGRGEH